MENLREKFLTNRDETGRFIVVSKETGRTYFVEAIGSSRPADWGSVDPVTGNLMVKKGWGKHSGSVTEEESLIVKENGFAKIHELEVGVSPLSFIEQLDKEHASKV